MKTKVESLRTFLFVFSLNALFTSYSYYFTPRKGYLYVHTHTHFKKNQVGLMGGLHLR